MPYLSLKAKLAEIIGSNIQPKIGMEGEVLYTEQEEGFIAVAEALSDAGLQCTLPAPFFRS